MDKPRFALTMKNEATGVERGMFPIRNAEGEVDQALLTKAFRDVMNNTRLTPEAKMEAYNACMDALTEMSLTKELDAEELGEAIDEAAEQAADTLRATLSDEDRKELAEMLPALHEAHERFLTESVKSLAVLFPNSHEALAKLRPKLFKRPEDESPDQDDEEVHELFRPYSPDGPPQEQAQVSIGGAAPATSPEENMPDQHYRRRTGDDFSFPTTGASLPAWRRRGPRIV